MATAPHSAARGTTGRRAAGVAWSCPASARPDGGTAAGSRVRTPQGATLRLHRASPAVVGVAGDARVSLPNRLPTRFGGAAGPGGFSGGSRPRREAVSPRLRLSSRGGAAVTMGIKPPHSGRTGQGVFQQISARPGGRRSLAGGESGRGCLQVGRRGTEVAAASSTFGGTSQVRDVSVLDSVSGLPLVHPLPSPQPHARLRQPPAPAGVCGDVGFSDPWCPERPDTGPQVTQPGQTPCLKGTVSLQSRPQAGTSLRNVCVSSRIE